MVCANVPDGSHLNGYKVVMCILEYYSVKINGKCFLFFSILYVNY